MESQQAARGRTQLGDLGPELLNAVFCKLGPSPMHLAAVSCVSRTWRGVMQEDTWRQLCLEGAPALCSALGYVGGGLVPPEGWMALYKLVAYCPGVRPTSRATPLLPMYAANPSSIHMLGHVDQLRGFRTGPAVFKALRLKEAFRRDVIYLSRPCLHTAHGPVNYDETFGCRGVVQNFAQSAIGAACGAAAFFAAPPHEQQAMRRAASIDDACEYCRAPLFPLSEETFFDNRRSESSGYVCGNGHLTLVVYEHKNEDGELQWNSHNRPLPGTGENIWMAVSSFSCELCSLAGSEADALSFRRSIDIFSARKKLRKIAKRIDEGHLGDKIENPFKIGPHTGRVALHDLEEEVRKEHKQVLQDVRRNLEAFKAASGMEVKSASDSDSDSESEVNTPFWDVDAEWYNTIHTAGVDVPDARKILGVYLDKQGKRSSLEAVNAMQRVRSLLAKERALVKMLEKRSKVIHAALREAGIPENHNHGDGAPFQGIWPDDRAVDMYIWESDYVVSIDDVIEKQRAQMEVDARMAAEIEGQQD